MSKETQRTHERQLATLRLQLEQSLIYQERLQKMLAIEEKELAELEAELAAVEQERQKAQYEPIPSGQL